MRHAHDGVLPHFEGYIGQLYPVPRPPSRKWRPSATRQYCPEVHVSLGPQSRTPPSSPPPLELPLLDPLELPLLDPLLEPLELPLLDPLLPPLELPLLDPLLPLEVLLPLELPLLDPLLLPPPELLPLPVLAPRSAEASAPPPPRGSAAPPH